MKTIKVRAWHTRLKKMFSAEEMAEDQMCLLPTGKFINIHPNPKLSVIDEADVMMPLLFTGRHDKNNKEIYEGDRVKTLYNHPFKFENEAPWIEGEIEYSHGEWMIDYPTHGVSIPLAVYYVADNIEVVGNIYENEDLLSGS